MSTSNPQAAGSNQTRTLLAQAAQAMQRGDAARSKALLERGLAVAPADPGINTNLALLCLREGKLERALSLLDNAIKADPHLYPAVLHQGVVLERLGRRREAIRAYSRGLAQAGDLSGVPPGLRGVVEQAKRAIIEHEAAVEEFIGSEMAALRAEYGERAFERVDEALAIRHGRVPRQSQRPTFMYFPGLPQRAFYSREEFSWIERIEAQTGTIREEFLQVMEQETGFRPYVEKPAGVPLAQWQALNRSLDWGAYHLYKDGVRQEENCARCPRTLEIVEQLPLSRIPEHEPEVFFSLLKPGTHIPPHTGAINTRLVVHLPLIVPPDCRLRVGNYTKNWKQGRCLIFDDTMEHEAWNNSDQLRVVFIFNIWNPHLAEAERKGMAKLVDAIGRFDRKC